MHPLDLEFALAPTFLFIFLFKYYFHFCMFANFFLVLIYSFVANTSLNVQILLVLAPFDYSRLCL
jgi:hypothetical protein